MEYLSPSERIAISNLYGVARKLLSDYPSELALVYKEILGDEINPSELNVSENAALLFECLYLEEGSYSQTFNILNESIADNSANDASTKLYGCVDPEAQNFNPDATIDDGSCMHQGSRATRSVCTDPDAYNYMQDGECTYFSAGYGGYGSCQCDLYSYSPDEPCHDECDGEGYPQGEDFCDDPNDDNYGYYGGNGDGIGLLNTLTAIGNALWGVVEAIGVDVIYDDIMNGNQNSLNTGGSNQSCPPGQVRCKKNGIDGCNAAIDCDTTEQEKSYTWLYVTLGVLVVGGLGYLIYKKNK